MVSISVAQFSLSSRSSCLSFPSAGITGMCPPHQAPKQYFKRTVLAFGKWIVLISSSSFPSSITASHLSYRLYENI
jgi:hypothetical protein